MFINFIGMFGLALAFPTVYIYSGELFPTMVRNIGVGTSSMCARIGKIQYNYLLNDTLNASGKIKLRVLSYVSEEKWMSF